MISSASEDSRAVLPVTLGFRQAQLWLVQFRCGAVGCSQQPGRVLLISQLVPLRELPLPGFYRLCPLMEGVKSC